AEELGGADVHSRQSGVTDHYAQNDAHAIGIARRIVATLKQPTKAALNMREPREPMFPAEEIYGVVSADGRKPFDVHDIIARLVDGSEFDEFKKLYGTTLVCGFAHIWGYPVGVIANNGILFSESSLKGAHFIELCCQREIPLLFLQNITGFMVGRKYEAGGGQWSAREEDEFRNPIRAQYDAQGHPYYATARLWDDGVIDPAETRHVLGLTLSVAANGPVVPTRFGVFRM